jgi:uncharacterized membrane protein
MICITAAIVPPFQNPDEPNHFARAEQVSRLEFVPVFVPGKIKNDTIPGIPQIFYPSNGGFDVDRGIVNASSVFLPMNFHPEVKVTQAKLDSVRYIKWGEGKVYLNFANTAIYPPVPYVMPAIAIALGKWLNLTVVNTLYTARIFNATLSVVLCFLALVLAKRSKPILFTVLLIPMLIALFAAVTADAVLISCSFLLIAIIDNVEYDKGKTYSNGLLLAIIILMSTIAIAKPPYIVFAFAFLFLNITTKQKLVIIAVPLLSVLSWMFIEHANYSIKFALAEQRVNSQMQIANIIHHPLQFISLFFKIDVNAVSGNLEMFVGKLGWLDVSFNKFYYLMAYLTIIAGFVLKFKLNKENNLLLQGGLLLTVLFALAAVLTAQYVTWTSLGADALGGMQGRYLLPVFPFLALAIGGYSGEIKMTNFKKALFLLILLFPLYTAINLTVTLLNRYY